MAKPKFYVVWSGRTPGIYTTWDECQKQIKGVEGAVYKSFKTREAAEKAYAGKSEDYIGKDVRDIEVTPEELRRIGRPIQDSIAVDAASSSSTKQMEYQGVYVQTGQQLFHRGPYKDGTNNVGEFLALVHALGYCKQKNINIPIYSDSRTAISWVRNKKAKTKMEQTLDNGQLFDLIERAENWLKNNRFSNKILKWETKVWGEIPADFGRK